MIEEINAGTLYSFWQIYKNKKRYYVDGLRIASSFNGFLDKIKDFVNNKYIIRLENHKDIIDWRRDEHCIEETGEFVKVLF